VRIAAVVVVTVVVVGFGKVANSADVASSPAELVLLGARNHLGVEGRVVVVVVVVVGRPVGEGVLYSGCFERACSD